MTVVKKTATQRWYRGYGPDQYIYYAQQGPKKYLGGTFEVESMDELEKCVSSQLNHETGPNIVMAELPKSQAPKSSTTAFKK